MQTTIGAIDIWLDDKCVEEIRENQTQTNQVWAWLTWNSYIQFDLPLLMSLYWAAQANIYLRVI